MISDISTDLTVMAPFVQWGFAGFCFVLFASLMWVIVWLVKNLLTVLKESNRVIAGNTGAITAIHTTADETKTLMSGIRDQLLMRPCLMDGERQRRLAKQTAGALERVAEQAASAVASVAEDAAIALKTKQD